MPWKLLLVIAAAVSGLVYGALQHHHRGASIDAGLIADLAVRALTEPCPAAPTVPAA